MKIFDIFSVLFNKLRYITFAEGPHYKYKQSNTCVVLSCHKFCISVKIEIMHFWHPFVTVYIFQYIFTISLNFSIFKWQIHLLTLLYYKVETNVAIKNTWSKRAPLPHLFVLANHTSKNAAKKCINGLKPIQIFPLGLFWLTQVRTFLIFFKC